MPHILLIDDSFPINTRNTKILESLEKYYGDDARISVVTWNRNNDCQTEKKDFYVYQKPSAYGQKIQKLKNLWGYRKFCHETIRRLNPDVVIASHWNNLLMVPKLDRKRQMLIYENLDVPTEGFLVRKVTTALEHRELQRVDLTIHASRFFTKLYSPKLPQMVLENKPVFSTPPPQEYTPHTPVRVAFIGLLRYLDISKVLADAVRGDSRFQLYFHGDGHAREQLKKYVGNEPNIFFTGRYAYDDVPTLYQQTDVVWAAYPNRDFNVKYAISNKFHESLAFGIPTVYADKTCLGDFVAEQNIGMVVDPYSLKSVKDLMETIITNPDELQKISGNMAAFRQQQTTWVEDFAAVTDRINQFFKDL